MRKADTIKQRVDRILRGNVLKRYVSTEIMYRKFEYTVDHEQLNSRAVSYTHLRAHETVLDLVCRLLIEKKKQKKDQKRGSKTTVDKEN